MWNMGEVIISITWALSWQLTNLKVQDMGPLYHRVCHSVFFPVSYIKLYCVVTVVIAQSWTSNSSHPRPNKLPMDYRFTPVLWRHMWTMLQTDKHCWKWNTWSCFFSMWRHGCAGMFVSEELMQEAFANYGEVQEVRIFKEKGYAFVRYESQANAHLAWARCVSLVSFHNLYSAFSFSGA